MTKTITEAIVDGYESGNVALLDALSAASDEVRAQFDELVIQPILSIIGNPRESGVATLAGHSDRVDTAGLSREQCRVQELEASTDRAFNAVDAIAQIVGERLGEEVPPDLNELPQLALIPRATGAAVLVENAEVLGEDQRRRNRRVMIRVVRFHDDRQ